VLGEGGIIVECDGLVERGFDACEDRQHDRNGLGGSLSGEPRCERHAGFAFMKNEHEPCALADDKVTFPILTDVFLHIASGMDWGGRKVKQGAVVYVAAEGAGGIRKRIEGWKIEHGKGLPAKMPFYLVTVAPNLGTGDADLKELIASIEAISVKPCAIGLDTLAQSLGAPMNSVGMANFVTNATALANHFQCFVPTIHHTPLSDDKRLRGNTTLIGGLDVAILAEREEGQLTAVLTIKKLKDEEDGQRLTVHLVRVRLGVDEDGEEVSTLVVQSRRYRRRQDPAQEINPAKYAIARFHSSASDHRVRKSVVQALRRWPARQSRIGRRCAPPLLFAARRKLRAGRRQ